jgi:hypothetical protein
MRRICWLAALTVAQFTWTCRLSAAVIDFETTPAAAVPIDNTELTDPYPIAGGGTVRFFFDSNGNNKFDAGLDAFPFLEAIGHNPPDGFHNDGKGNDDVADDGFQSQLGSFFLRHPTGIGPVPPPFIATFNSAFPITAVSGEIWDIDGTASEGTEQWRVDVLSAAGGILATLNSPNGSTNGSNSLDGRPWEFDFVNLPDGVGEVRLTFIGTKTDGVGLAFNNFNATVGVPEPTSLIMAGIGVLIAIAASISGNRHVRGSACRETTAIRSQDRSCTGSGVVTIALRGRR